MGELQRGGHITLSRSLYVSPSRLTLPMRSTSKARVARMRLREEGVGNVFSSTLKNAWVSNGGLWYVEVCGSALLVEESIKAGGPGGDEEEEEDR